MKIKFTSDYRGTLTQERFYTAGTIADFEEPTAGAIVQVGRAEFVDEPKPEPEPNKTTRTKRSRKSS